jgi:hypothetical protein
MCGTQYGFVDAECGSGRMVFYDINHNTWVVNSPTGFLTDILKDMALPNGGQ